MTAMSQDFNIQLMYHNKNNLFFFKGNFSASSLQPNTCLLFIIGVTIRRLFISKLKDR